MVKILEEGDLFLTEDEVLTSGPRVAVLPDGALLCTFMLNSGGGKNDFVPMAAWSSDGSSWSVARPIWPEYIGKKSIFVSARSAEDGRVTLAGKWWDIAHEGESFWSDEEAAMKKNELVIAVSEDGRTFPPPTAIPLPLPGAAEMPGGMLLTADGTMYILYSPYPAIGEGEAVDTGSMILLRGKLPDSLTAQKVAVTKEVSQYGEAWIVHLTDGRFFISTWQTASAEVPDQYLIGTADTLSEVPVRPLPFKGQSMGACPLPDGTILIAYNQRKEDPAGVYLAHLAVNRGAGAVRSFRNPGEVQDGESGYNPGGLRLLSNDPVYFAAQTTRSGSSGDFDAWTDFSFGEPGVSLLPDGSVMVVLWYQDGNKKGIRYVRVALELVREDL